MTWKLFKESDGNSLKVVRAMKPQGRQVKSSKTCDILSQNIYSQCLVDLKEEIESKSTELLDEYCYPTLLQGRSMAVLSNVDLTIDMKRLLYHLFLLDFTLCFYRT